MNFVAELIDHHMSVLRQLLDRAGELTDSQLNAVIELPVEGIDDNPTAAPCCPGWSGSWTCERKPWPVSPTTSRSNGTRP